MKFLVLELSLNFKVPQRLLNKYLVLLHSLSLGGHVVFHRGPAGRFTEYTLLTASRKRILAECSNAEFKDGDARHPRYAPINPGADITKYCQYHQSHGHLTKDCIHLKDSIETLIKAGRLGQYRRNNARRWDNCEVKEIKEDTRPSYELGPLQVAFSISNPNDFHIPDIFEDEEPLSTHSKWEKFTFPWSYLTGDSTTTW